MSRLIAFGDSFTYGQGLDGTGIAHAEPHPDAWPEQMRSLLGVDTVINLSKPGASNKQIWFTILSFDFEPTDIVVICWTCYNRTMLIKDLRSLSIDTLEQDLSDRRRLSQYGPWMEDQPHIMQYYLDHWHSTDSYISFCGMMDHVDSHLRNIVGNAVFHSCIPSCIEFNALISNNPPFREEDLIEHRRYMVEELQLDPQHSLELQSISIPLDYGKPNWMRSHIIASMDYESRRYGQAPDGHLHVRGHVHFASRMINLMRQESPEVFLD